MRRQLIILSLVLLLPACVRQQQEVTGKYVEVQENSIPGTVTEPWVEPMYDTVKVPGRLDPSGTYYRPSHKTVVEVRPGRVQPVQYPEQNESEIKKEFK